jgi:hypothetical protein
MAYVTSPRSKCRRLGLGLAIPFHFPLLILLETGSAWTPEPLASNLNRKLAAILAADVVGYSRLMGADEEGTMSALKQHRQTGVTRGKRLVVLVEQKKAVAIAVRNASGRRRWSKLAEWLAQKPAEAGG